MPLVEQELFTLLEHLSSPSVFSGIRVTRSLVLYVCFVDRCLSFCTFSFGHCVVCSSSIYGFCLILMLYLFIEDYKQPEVSVYSFGIFKPFIIYIYYWNFQFLNNVNIIKINVHFPGGIHNLNRFWLYFLGPFICLPYNKDLMYLPLQFFALNVLGES